MTNITYLSASIIPSERANSVQVMQMCNAFVQNGARVNLICTAGRVATDDVYADYGVSGNFRLIAMHLRDFKGYGIWLACKAAFLTLQSSADLVYARYLRAAVLVGLAGKPVYYEMHDLPGNHSDRMAWGLLRRLPALRGIICISQALAESVARQYPQIADRILVMADGASDASILPAPATWPAHPRPRLGYIGSLHPGKGVEFILGLARKMPEADFVMVGGPHERVAALEKTAPENVVFLGPKTASDALAARSDMDVLLAPYMSKVSSAGGANIGLWMSPLKIFEYMASGRPMVCSDLPVLREVLDDEIAQLVEAGDTEAWKNAINSLIDLPDSAMIMALRAQQRFSDTYTWNMRASKILQWLGQTK